jgi:hypothetical protein
MLLGKMIIYMKLLVDMLTQQGSKILLFLLLIILPARMHSQVIKGFLKEN